MINIKPTHLMQWLVTGALIIILFTESGHACTQSEMDEIARVSSLMREFTFMHAKCTSIGSNSARSSCWKENQLSAEDLKKYSTIDSEYSSFLASCRWDSIKYNLGNFRQSFSFECEAFKSFENIEETSRYKEIGRIMADSALQCAINSKESEWFEEKRATLREFMWKIVKRDSEASVGNRKNAGRLLGVWRDYFALGAESNDSLSIASSIHASDAEWVNWTMFLDYLRGHLVSWRSSLFPNRDNIDLTAKQYGLSISKLTK